MPLGTSWGEHIPSCRLVPACRLPTVTMGCVVLVPLMSAVLETIKTVQSQHGLRHDDFGRYRCVRVRRCCVALGVLVSLSCAVCRCATVVDADGKTSRLLACLVDCSEYCTRRLHRLRKGKGMKMLQGRRTFEKKDVVVEKVTDVRSVECAAHRFSRHSPLHLCSMYCVAVFTW